MASKNTFNSVLRSILQIYSSTNPRRPSLVMEVGKYFISDDMKKENVILPTIYNTIESIADKITLLLEAATRPDCLNRASRAIGSLYLLSPFDDLHVAKVNKRYKPIYRLIVAIRFLDEMLFQDRCKSGYLKQYWHGYERFESKDDFLQYKEMFIKPLVYSILIESAVFEHPDAVNILKGTKDEKILDEFRTLQPAERIALSRVTSQAQSEVLTELLAYRRMKRINGSETPQINDDFNVYCKSLYSLSRDSSKELGSTLKIASIYASAILPTKNNPSRKSTVEAFKFLSLHVEKGKLSKSIATSFMRMFGIFPQGFGVTCAVENSSNKQITVEKAIVNKLYPSEPTSPHCRVVTRFNEFDRGFRDQVIKRGVNLFFKAVFDEHSKTVVRRMASTLEQAENADELLEEFLPRLWDPHEYFGTREVNIWNNVSYDEFKESAA